jgi:hypothetical protein
LRLQPNKHGCKGFSGLKERGVSVERRVRKKTKKFGAGFDENGGAGHKNLQSQQNRGSRTSKLELATTISCIGEYGVKQIGILVVRLALGVK